MTVLFLVFWLFGVLIAVTFAVPGTVPGQPNVVAALIAVGLLLAGAWLEAGKCRWRPIFFIYGCLGGLAFILLFYPDARTLLAQTSCSKAAERWLDCAFTIGSIIGVVSAGLVCRRVARARHEWDDNRLRASGRCRKCGYSLRGLPELRCPECGTPFDPADQPTDDLPPL